MINDRFDLVYSNINSEVTSRSNTKYCLSLHIYHRVPIVNNCVNTAAMTTMYNGNPVNKH